MSNIESTKNVSNPREYWPRKCGYPEGVGSYKEFKAALGWFEENSATFSHTVFRGESKHFETYCSPSIVRSPRKLTRNFTGENVITDQEIRLALLSSGDKFDDNVFLNTQHYGGQTRLLDVTSAEQVALFFACDSNFNDDGYVYIFFGSTTLPLWSPETNTLESILEYYNFIKRSDVCYLIESFESKPKRMKSQLGAFLCWREPSDPIPGLVCVIKIKNSAKKKIFNEIIEYGWTPEELFPDLFGDWLKMTINYS